MKNIKICYPGFKKKCFTLSYDDGVLQDIPFLEMINLYGVKCTFNLNSGLFGQIKYRNGNNNSRLSLEEVKKLYYGHEIASHSLYHFHLEKLSYEDNFYQINKDIINLESIFNKKINGFAYPFGKYSLDTIKVLKENKVMYARTTKSSYKFDVDINNLLEYNPTCSHSDRKLKDIAVDFLKTDNELALFYVWGHSYEFENNNNWDVLRMLLEILKDDNDIAYLTNFEAFKYIIETKKLEVNDRYIINNSDIDIYLIINGIEMICKPKEEILLEE